MLRPYVKKILLTLFMGNLWDHQQHSNPVIGFIHFGDRWIEQMDDIFQEPYLIKKSPILKNMIQAGLVEDYFHITHQKANDDSYFLVLTDIGYDFCKNVLLKNYYKAYLKYRDGLSWYEPRPKTFWHKMYKNPNYFKATPVTKAKMHKWILKYPHYKQYVDPKHFNLGFNKLFKKGEQIHDN